MNDQSSMPLHALPDGEAELRVVLRLRWEDVARLGQEASRLATQMQRPVSLDEAASHSFRTRTGGAHAAQSNGQQSAQPAAPAAPATPVALAGRTPTEQAREAIDKIHGDGSAAPPAPAGQPGPR